MKIHILGVCGTFMGGIACLAQQLGHQVDGSDQNVYPPMSEELAKAGIVVKQGYEPDRLDPRPDLVIVGNALSRGNRSVEYVLSEKIPYVSGPQWLAEHVLPGRMVFAVSGTHGKTTTSSMLTWILHAAGRNPGFLIGGVPENFGCSAAIGGPDLFVVEGDEYDTAFFDKRSKFVHYHPDVLIVNNIEYDHADIFPDVAAINRQFHHLIRTVPGNGRVIARAGSPQIDALLGMGIWSPLTRFGNVSSDWHSAPLNRDYSEFEVIHAGQAVGIVNWPLFGEHNAENALAALIAAQQAGITPQQACESLSGFASVKRRLQLLASVDGVSVYDDFAHHPTAIRSALQALRSRIGEERLIAVLELRSNTMKAGIHKHTLSDALCGADRVCVYEPPGLGWDLRTSLNGLGDRLRIFPGVTDIIGYLDRIRMPRDHVLIMSNGGFENIYRRLIERLSD